MIKISLKKKLETQNPKTQIVFGAYATIKKNTQFLTSFLSYKKLGYTF